MELKQTVRYRMNFESGWLTASAFFAGLGIFCTALYYFVLNDISAIQSGTMVLHVALPLVWFVAYVVLLKGIQLNIPLVFGGLAAVYCLLMVIWGFVTPTILGSVMGAVFFLLAAAAFVATTMGLIPGKFYLAAALLAVVLIQLCWRDLAAYVLTLRIKDYLPMLTKLSGVAAIGLLCLGMQGFPVKKSGK